MNRIEWSHTANGGLVGFVMIADGRVKIASVSPSFNRADKKPWVLRTEVPGWTNARHHPDVDESPWAGPERLIARPTGHGLIKLDDLQKLADRIALLESRWASRWEEL